jgi:hypothetical protein
MKRRGEGKARNRKNAQVEGDKLKSQTHTVNSKRHSPAARHRLYTDEEHKSQGESNCKSRRRQHDTNVTVGGE